MVLSVLFSIVPCKVNNLHNDVLRNDSFFSQLSWDKTSGNAYLFFGPQPLRRTILKTFRRRMLLTSTKRARWPRTASVLVKRKSYREPLDGVFSGNYRTASRQTSRLCLLDRDNARRYVKVSPFLQLGCDVTAHNEEPTCGHRRRRVSSNFKRCFWSLTDIFPVKD